MTRRCYAVLAKVSLSYSPLQGRLVTCYSPVRHFTQVLLPFLVRLACVRHAASVDSEPGSNSRLILVCSTQSGRRSDWSGVPRSLEKDRRVINSENDSTKVSRHLTTGTFNYVVKDPDCIRTRRAVLDQGPTPDKAQLCVLELDALYVLSEASGMYSPASRQCFARTFQCYRSSLLVSTRNLLSILSPSPVGPYSTLTANLTAFPSGRYPDASPAGLA